MPPLNFSQTGKLWPMMAAVPAYKAATRLVEVKMPAKNMSSAGTKRSASQAAKDADAYLELIEPGHDSNYSQADYLRIGIASQVDGIILEADGSDEEQELIQEASDADIPVVTVLTDDSSSARISFVGLNSYQLGNA